MTGFRDDIDNGRLIPPSEEVRVEERYLLGKYRYGIESKPEKPDSNHRLYPKYWHTDYGEFKQNNRYLSLYEELQIVEFNGSVDPDDLDDYLDKIGISEFQKKDEAFVEHIREAYCVPGQSVPSEKASEAARLWIKYVLERGPKCND